MPRGVMLVARLVFTVLSILASGPIYAATPPDARRLDHMRYFILDDAQQNGVRRGHAFVVIIGRPAATTFQLRYTGNLSALPGNRYARRLVA